CPGSKVKISLSIDGVGEKHDEIRSIKGLFAKLIETHRLLLSLNDENLAVNVATTLSSLNKDQIHEVIAYVREHLQINDHSMSYVRGDVRDPSTKNVTPEEYRRAWTSLLEGRQNKNHGYFRIFNNIIRSMYEVNQT